MPSYIGFDSKELRRADKESGKEFISTIGVSIEVFDLKKFNEIYDKAIEMVFKKHGLERKRRVYHFQYFCKMYGLESAKEICIDFLHRIREYVLNVGIYFANISPNKIPYVFMYSMDGKKERMPTRKFLASLVSPFPYICAWKYMQENKDIDSVFILDHFQGKLTPSWSVFHLKKPVIYFRGDQCNSIISTADILAGVIDQYLYGEQISIKSINEILYEFSFNGKAYVIGSRDLRWIAPVSRKLISTGVFVRHPIYFIITEKRPSMMDYKEHRDQLEFSPLFDIVTSKAFENNGCVKLYEITEDYKLIKSIDRVIYYGDRGKEIAEILKSQYGLSYVFDFRIEKKKIQ